MQPKASKTLIHNSNDVPEKEHTGHRFSGAISSSFVSIGDLFNMRDGKSVKFPEKLLKVLEQKLQNIAMGKDPACVVNYLHRHEPRVDNLAKLF